MDVSDRRMQVQLTQEAKIVSDFYSIRAIFAFVGFVSALIRLKTIVFRRILPFPPFCTRQTIFTILVWQ